MAAWKMAGLTDRGRVREVNEDAIAWDAEAGWAVLADGMGGHQAGEVASTLAVEIIADGIKGADGAHRATVLERAVKQANITIFQQSDDQPRYFAMGTTVVAVDLDADRLLCAHVGDSRLYRLRDGELQQLTRDHSLVQELVDEGMINPEQARTSAQRNVITRALGLEPTVEVEMHEEQTRTGDSYLLCSDGLSNMLRHEEIAALLAVDALPEAVAGLVEAANENGGEDNISVIVIRVWE